MRPLSLRNQLEDGQIEFLSSVDQQIKVRGFRIELDEIETAVVSYPNIRDCVVAVHGDKAQDKQLVAYVVLGNEASDKATNQGLDRERMNDWQIIFEETYRHSTEGENVLHAGWNSSYTGKAIPSEEMEQWRSATVERIRLLQPRRALEIGCGLGLLLQNLAPSCEVYCGLDFSDKVLQDLRVRLDAEDPVAAHAQLFHRSADQLHDLPGPFDTVIINSVVQYFPNIEYLIRVLDGVFENLAPDGTVFLGDLRNLALAEAFHAHVQLSHAPDSLAIQTLRERVRRSIVDEDELVLNPALFSALPSRYPQISYVEVQLKRGHDNNEMTRFRYDVTIHTAPTPGPSEKALVLDWDQVQTLDKVQALMKSEDEFILRNIPNTRTIEPVAVWSRMATPGSTTTLSTVADLRRELRMLVPGIEPEDLWQLQSDTHDIYLTWAGSFGADGYFDAHLKSRILPIAATQKAATVKGQSHQRFKQFANNPLQAKFAVRLESDLRRFLQSRLPEKMIPSYFVLMNKLPRSANGKLDRKALPPPLTRRLDTENFAAPSTPTEQAIARIWSDLLGFEQIGKRDNFFELGGNSLIAVQLVVRISVDLNTLLSVQSLFQDKTIEAQARRIDEQKDSGETFATVG